MQKYTGRDGREQHHFEMFICREKKLKKQEERKAICMSCIFSVVLAVVTFISWLVR